METFGQYLKTHRDKRGIRLEEIASITKIHLKSLEMLERNQFKKLPPEPFIRGFITAYAKYVGIDPNEAITRYQEEIGALAVPDKAATDGAGVSPGKALTKERVESAPIPPPPSGHEDKATHVPARKFAIAFGALGVLLVIGGLVYIGKSSNRGETTAESTPTVQSAAVEVKPSSVPTPKDSKESKDTQEQVVSAAPAPSAPTQVLSADTKTEVRGVASPNEPVKAAVESTAPPSEFKHEVLVEGKERTWIKVVVDEEAPIDFFLPEGQKANYKAKSKIKVVLGNSSGTKVTHNGEVMPGVKFQGTIRSYIFPADAKFPQDAPSKRIPSSKVLEEELKNVENQ